MRCGACDGDHDTVAEVRECSKANVPPMTDPQMRFADALLRERDLEAAPRVLGQAAKALNEVIARYREHGAALGVSLGREMITALKVLPDKPRTGLSVNPRGLHDGVPAGRYAVMHLDQGEEWYFYQVDIGKGERWEGVRFVKRLIGAPGDFRQVNLRKDTAQEVLRDIQQEGIKESALAFGKQVGQCPACASPLTNASSIAAGIGPVCASKRGW